MKTLLKIIVSPSSAKRLLIRIFLTVFSYAIVAGAAAQETPQVKNRIIIRGDHNYPPYEFLENGKPSGFNVELIRAVTEVMGIEADISLDNWDRVLNALESGEIDAITSMVYSKERDQIFDFAVPHFKASHAIFVRKDSDIESLEDISTKEIIVQKGDIAHEYAIENSLSRNLITVDDQTQALKLLASGEHDCALLSRLVGLYILRKNKIETIKTVGDPIIQRDYCFAVRKGNSDLLFQLNEGLSIIKETGKYKELNDKWFGVYLKPVFFRTMMKYVLLLLVPLILLLIAAFCWSWSLKRLVNKRTVELENELEERKRTEKSLNESQGRFRTLFDSTFEGIVIYNHRNGDILEVNLPAASLIGYEKEELIGRKIIDIVAEESREDIMKKVAAAVENPSIILGAYEMLGLKKDGTKISVEVHSKGFFYKGEIVRIVGFRDISERKLMEKALLENEAKFRAITENTTDITAIVDENGEYIYCSPSVKKIFGFAPGDVVGRTNVGLLHEDIPEFVKIIEKAKKNQGKTFHIDKFRIRHSEGHIMYLEALVTSMLDVTGVNGIVINSRDITERVKAQELLTESERKLRRMNDELVSIANNKTVVSGDIEAAYREITEAAVNTLETDSSSIWLNDKVRDLYTCHDMYVSETGEHSGGIEVCGIMEEEEKFHEIHDRRIIAVDDVNTDPFLKNMYEQHFPGSGITSTIKAQIRSGGKVAGVLSIDHTGSVRKWTAEEQNFAGSLADIASIAIETSERIKAEKGLGNKIVLETLTSQIAAKFMDISPFEIDIGIDHALQRIGEFEDIDRIYVYIFNDDGTRMSNTHEWCAEGIEPEIMNLQDLDTSKFPWWTDRLKKLEIVHIPSVDKMPDDAAVEREILKSFNVKSELVVPMEFHRSLYGYIGFDSVKTEKHWSDDFILVLEQVGRIIVGALESKRLHEELREANEDLERKVEDRTLELRQKQAQLVQSEKMAALGNLVAGVAHEINTPLGALKSNNDIVMRSIARMKTILADTISPEEEPDNPQLVKLFGSIDKLNEVSKTASDRIVKIVNSLRTFARLDKADMDTVDIHEGIDSTLTLVHHELKNRIEVHKEYGELPRISCYPNQLNQVFMNILINASHAIDKTGDIYIRTKLKDDKVVIEIEDNGKGIPKENLKRIFDPGYTTKSKGIGTGLGLSIVYKIIEDHKGSLEVESQVDKGTIFKIYLPL
ncbi:PAS domain S-box protein [Candidatus Latescibacterota bacterium]